VGMMQKPFRASAHAEKENRLSRRGLSRFRIDSTPRMSEPDVAAPGFIVSE
jgi:hypothetical protein